MPLLLRTISGRRAIGPAPRSLFALAAVALGLWAHAASGAASGSATGLYLNWNDCPLGGAAASDAQWLCDTNVGDHTLYCAFVLGAPRDSVLGVEAVVDLQHVQTPLPDWWHCEPLGCRPGALIQSGGDFTGLSACVDPWQGQAVGGVQGYTVGPPDHPLPSQSRVKVVAAVPSNLAASLDAVSMYYAVKIVVSHTQTVLAGGCSGCLSAACLVLNSILIRRIPGATGGDEFLQTPGPANANWATWQGTGADCMAVPVRRATWGRLKSLYR